MGENKRSYYDPMFGGTEKYNMYSPLGPAFPALKLTDSVVHFAEEKQAYWVVDVVYSYLPKIVEEMRKNNTDIVFLNFDVDDGKCEFYGKLDSPLPKFIRQEIEFTDLDVSVKFYLQNGVLMFPSDY